MSSDKITIEVWSDVVCPFCFVGKKKLEKAIADLNANDKVEIVWKSFQLDPNFPKDTALPSTAYLAQHKGYPIEQVRAMSQHLVHQGKEYNIDFNFDKALTFNTLDAHRLLHWAKTKQSAHKLKEALMVAYFTNGINLSDQNNLLKVVASVGLNRNEAQEVLNSDNFSKEVEQDIYEAQQTGVRGVPFFLINDKRTISGAQADEVFYKTLEAELSNLKPLIDTDGAGICLPNGKCE